MARVRLLLLPMVLFALVMTTAATGGATRVVHPPRVKGPSHRTSLNWSGYVASGQQFSDVRGSWSQPTVTCTVANKKGKPRPSGPGYSSVWVGLDGYTSPSVEQTGTEADCGNGGTAFYYAWYELYPAATVVLDPASYPVEPGDSLSGEVNATTGTITLADSTQGWTFTQNGVDFSGDQLSSAEWIAEAPFHGHILPLSDFGTVTFTNATADGAPISSYGTVDPITMTDHKGVVRATPSALGGNGSTFSITWSHT